jgi:glycine oxidase
VPELPSRFDAVVLGAGFVGAAAARALASRGARVLVLDADARGGLGSRAAAGVAVPSLRLAADPVLREFVREGKRRLDAEVAELARSDPSLRQGRGVLRLVLREAQRGEMEQSASSAGLELGRWLPAAELAEAEPLLAGGPALGGFLDPAGYLVDPGRYLDGLLEAAKRQGAHLRLATSASTVAEEEGGVVVRTGDGRLECDVVVVAAGAWSSRLPGLEALGVRPLRGQALALEPPPGSRLGHVVSTYLGYLAPAADGILVGATEEDAGYAARVTAAGLLHLTSTVAKLSPPLRDAEVRRTWAGLRSATANGRPLIGWAPGRRRVIVATGHGGQGVLTATLTGAAVVELVERGSSEIAAPFDPGRAVAP